MWAYCKIIRAENPGQSTVDRRHIPCSGTCQCKSSVASDARFRPLNVVIFYRPARMQQGMQRKCLKVGS